MRYSHYSRPGSGFARARAEFRYYAQRGGVRLW